MYKHYIEIDQIQREIEVEVALNQKSYIESEAPIGVYIVKAGLMGLLEINQDIKSLRHTA